jgi:hypothetical protein
LERAIGKRLDSKSAPSPVAEIRSILLEVSQQFYDECRAHLATDHLRFHKPLNKSLDDSDHFKEAMRRLDASWGDLDRRLTTIPGKDFIAALSASLQKKFGTSITIHQIVDEMTAQEVDIELVEKLESLTTFFRAGATAASNIGTQ